MVLHWTNLNPLLPKMHCGRFGWHWPGGFDNLVKIVLEKNISKFIMYITYLWLSPLVQGRGPSFEETWIPFTKDVLCQVWLKLILWFWRREWKCEKFTTKTTKRTTTDIFWSEHSFLNKFDSLSPKNALCQVWLKLAQWFSRRIF